MNLLPEHIVTNNIISNIHNINDIMSTTPSQRFILFPIIVLELRYLTILSIFIEYSKIHNKKDVCSYTEQTSFQEYRFFIHLWIYTIYSTLQPFNICM